MRYKLNFKGFYDTPEMLFGNSIASKKEGCAE